MQFKHATRTTRDGSGSARPTGRIRAWAGVIVVGLAVSACGADDSESAVTPDTEPPASDVTVTTYGAVTNSRSTGSGSAVPNEKPEAVSETTEAPVSETTEVEAVAELGVDSCILGAWKLDNESFAEAMETLSSAGGFPLDVEMSGDDYVRFTASPGDDEPVLVFSSRRVDFTMTFATGGSMVDFLLNSEEAATFGTATAADGSGVLWLTDTMTISERAEMISDVATVVLDSDESGSIDIFGRIDAELPPTVPEEFDGVAGYECRPGELLLTTSPDPSEFEDEDVDLAALPQFLTVRFTSSTWPDD